MSSTLDYRLFFREEDGEQREYWGDEAAGCIFVAKDTGRILLAHRSDNVGYEPLTWGTWGGKVDLDETPKQTVEREVEEETGFGGHYKINRLWTYQDGEFQYHNYLVVVPFEFKPQLNWENDTSAWVEYGEWPDPRHFGMEELIKHAGHKIKRVIDLIKKKNAEILESMDVPPAIIQHIGLSKTSGMMDAKAMVNAYIVAATLWGEARGEGEQGIQAVLNVIVNRANQDFSKASSIALKPKQFSIWNGISNPEKKSVQLAKKMRDDKTYQTVIRLVDLASKGKLPDITGGATFYFNPKKANPSWAKKLTHTTDIGNHKFYKVPDKTQPIKENLNRVTITKQGLIDDGIYGYEMKTNTSYIRYGHNPDTKMFYMYNIGTLNVDDRNKGYAKSLLDTFFQLIKQNRGSLTAGSYTTSGMAYIDHLIQKLSKQYGVRLVGW